MIENLKARFKAKKYNIWTEQIDPKRKADGWFSGDWYATAVVFRRKKVLHIATSIC